MTMAQYADYLVAWLEKQRTELYRLRGYVLGLSGGVDSAVCLCLLARTGAPLRVFMLPTALNQAQDLDDARDVLRSCDSHGEVIPIQPMVDVMMESVQDALAQDCERLQVLRGNLMARLRMTTLYTIAQSHHAVVVGTGNAAEFYTGYFTKFGDGAADVLPLAHLRKEQVYELGALLGVPERIMRKAPSAGLWQGQTDEGEMGVSYREIDAFLRGETVSAAARERIAYWHERSHHKRMSTPVPKKKTTDQDFSGHCKRS